MNNDNFRDFATKHVGINSLTLDRYNDLYSNYISPTIIEERQMNIATMDVFSRLMMDHLNCIYLPESMKWMFYMASTGFRRSMFLK